MFDLAVVGAGPAGCASAIWGAMHGLKVVLFERGRSLRARPGDCFHPGIEPLFESLGVLEKVREYAKIRPTTRTVVCATERRVETFGFSLDGPWRAWHLLRSDLDAILLQRAQRLGVTLVMPCSHVSPVASRERPTLDVDGHLFPHTFLIDASGQSAWLTRAMGARLVPASPRLTAFYGYEQGRLSQEQAFESSADGWTWTCQISPSVTTWTMLRFGIHKRPTSFLGEERASTSRSIGANVTWRIASSLAGSTYFVVGDAACVTDPACGNGVLRALMSGIKAAHNAQAIISGRTSAADATHEYETWLRQWFHNDTEHVSALYDALRNDWRAVAEAPSDPLAAS